MLSIKKIWIGLAIILIGAFLSSCGPSPEEQTATAVALTAAAATSTPTVTPTFTPTPTSTHTPTPTPTPIPYDLSVLVTGDEDAPIVGAIVVLAEIGTEIGTQITDDVGQAFWYDLPEETVNLSISAQGYFPLEKTDSIKRGINQVAVVLERDPPGLLPSEACAPGERLLYIEDFQDGEAQGWPEIEYRAQDWDIGPGPDMPGDMVLFRPAEHEGGAEFHDQTFDNAVWRLQFMPIGMPIFHFDWHWAKDYEVEEGTVRRSNYSLWFHPPDIRVFRSQRDLFPTINLRDVVRTMKRDVWHQIEISTYEGTLEVWIDGVRFLSYEDPKPLPGGIMTLGQGYEEPLDPQSIVYYDDIVVCELTAPFVPMPTPEPTPLPGDLVYPVDTLSNDIPWLPLDEDKRPTSCYFGFNLEMPPFNNILVRQAFAAAVDRQVIADLADRFYFENARPATSLTPPETMGRDLYENIGIPFDPIRAKSLLAEAGYTDIEKFPDVTLVVSTRGEAAPGAYSRMADAIVEMWQQHLGILVEVDVIGDDAYYFRDLLPNNLPHIYQLTWGADLNDPDNFLRELFHSTSRFNHGHFSDKQFDNLVEQASIKNDPAERQELYIQAERILTEDLAGIIPLYHSYFYLGR